MKAGEVIDTAECEGEEEEGQVCANPIGTPACPFCKSRNSRIPEIQFLIYKMFEHEKLHISGQNY